MAWRSGGGMVLCGGDGKDQPGGSGLLLQRARLAALGTMGNFSSEGIVSLSLICLITGGHTDG